MRTRFAYVAIFVLAGTWSAAQTPFSHKGLDGMHPGSSAAPNEEVDPASGALLVVGTDLVLPGNAGLDLRIQRVYNSAVYPDYASGSTALDEDSWAGIGWKLHFGRIIDPDAIGAGQTQIEMGDGSRRALYHSIVNSTIWTTADFWIYDRAAHTLKLPNGVVYTFDRAVFLNDRLGTVRYVTEIRDVFQNRITFTYFDSNGPPDGIAAIDQYLDAAGTQVRHIAFTYNSTLKALATMSYLGHTWTYTQQAAGPPGYSVLQAVQPPAGTGWQYSYSASMTGEMTGVTTPAGGQVSYVYADALRRAGSLTQNSRVVGSRTTSGPSINGGTWTYSYGTGSNQDTTVVSCPCGVQRYKFNGTGVSGDFTGWSSGTLAEQTIEETNGTVRERRTYTWGRGEAISGDLVVGVNGVWTDNAVYKALPSQVSVTRGSHTWTTTFGFHFGQGNYNDYGNPYFIEESGDTAYQRRITQRTFRHNFTPYIVGRVSTETITMQVSYSQWTGQSDRSWTYDSATGFGTSRTVDGIVTTFEATTTGNVAAAIDALGHRTAYTYSWGGVTTEQTPKVTSTYVVAPEGYITSATSGGLTTTYEYDAAFRPTFVWPPATNPIEYVYDNLYGRFIRTYRGAALVEEQFDGFGQSSTTGVGSATPGAALVRTRIAVDPCGRTYFTSVPYTAGSGAVGTTTTYDALGRVLQVTDPASNVKSFSYDGVTITRTDQDNRQTIFEYMAFGAPSADRLVSVTDAMNVITKYEYDVLGTLTKVTGPGSGVTRTWTLNSHNLVGSDTQPESGTTTYLYDAVGNLTQITNAAAEVTTLQYDENNRLTARDGSGTSGDITTTYVTGSGRVGTVSGGGVVTTFGYDNAGRVSLRTDVIAGQTWTSRYGYDVNDNLTSLTYPSGRVVTYEYDAANRLTTVRNNGAVFADQFTYADSGAVSSFRTGTVVQTLTYEASTRIKRITAGSALDLTYSYNGVSQVTQIVDPRPGANQTFTYDPLDRLQTAQGPWGSTSWIYDPRGNRQTETNGSTTTYTYSATTQRLMSMSGGMTDSFGYDDAGRLISDSRGTYSYSSRSQLAQVVSPTVTASYGYDAGGSRIARTVNGVTMYTTYSAGSQPLSEYQTTCGAMVWTRDTVYAGDRVLGAVRANLAQPTVGFVNAAISVGEAQTSATASIRITTSNGAPTTCPVTVSYHAVAGTASPADFAATDATITFAAGTASGTSQTVALGIVNDALDESDETVTLTLLSAVGATLGAPSSSVITIVDDDPPPTLAIQNASTVEGTGVTSTLRFFVSLSGASGRTVTVSYATADRSAVASGDYVAQAGTVTFAPGITTQEIDVPVNGDAVDETDEFLAVVLSSPISATLARPAANGLIYDDDGGALSPNRDFNGDGWPDLVWRHAVSGDLSLWHMNSVTQVNGLYLTPQTLSDLSWEIRAVGDMNADGHPDLVWQNRASGSLAVWFFNDTVRLSTGSLVTLTGVSAEPDLNWIIVAAADMNRDGAIDLLWQHTGTGALRIWHMSGSMQIDSVPLSLQFGDPQWAVAAVGDLNQDGRPDVVFRNLSGGGLTSWLMDDAVVLQGLAVYPDVVSDLNWRIVGMADLSGDGKPDLVWQHATTGQLSAWFMNGAVTAATSALTPSPVTDLNWRIVGVR